MLLIFRGHININFELAFILILAQVLVVFGKLIVTLFS